MGEALVDERGRIVIPRVLRTELRLRPRQKLRVEARGKELVLIPSVSPDEFMEQLKGCVSGSRLRIEELKQIWGVEHPHN